MSYSPSRLLCQKLTTAPAIGAPCGVSTRPDKISSGSSPGSSRFDRCGAPSRKYGPSISHGVCGSSPGPGGSTCRTPSVLPDITPATPGPSTFAVLACPCTVMMISFRVTRLLKGVQPVSRCFASSGTPDSLGRDLGSGDKSVELGPHHLGMYPLDVRRLGEAAVGAADD